MIKSIGQLFFLALSCLAIAILQFSFISSFPGAFNQINIGLIAMVFILFFFGIKSAILFIFFFGSFMDIFSFQFFSFHLLVLATVSLVVYLILENWLTNKSLYSFWVLCLIASVTYGFISSILLFVFSGLGGGFSIFSLYFWQSLLYQSLWLLLVASLFFNIFVSLAKRFKPFFLEKKGVI
jgi:hypothetical protein